jgi:hypothetical protein
MRHRHRAQPLCKLRINLEAPDRVREKIFTKIAAAQNRVIPARFIQF